MANRLTTRTRSVTIKLTEKDYALLTELANKFGLDMSNLLRMILHQFKNCGLQINVKEDE